MERGRQNQRRSACIGAVHVLSPVSRSPPFILRILITGGSGLLGGNLAFIAAARHEVRATYRRPPVVIAGCQMHQLDLADGRQISRLIESIDPHVVVHTAAMTNADECEKRKYEAWQINVVATEHLARACKQAGSKLIYISTDLIFDGQKGWYAEEDEPNPLSHYGQTKLEAERLLTRYDLNYCIIRSALMYGWNIRPDKLCHSEWMLAALRAGQSINLFTDQYRSPILVNNLCEVVPSTRLRRRPEFIEGTGLDICHKDLRGIYHVGGPQRVSRYDFGRALTQVYGFGEERLNPTAQDEAGLTAPRPRDCSLDTAKAQADLDVPLLDVQAGLRRFKELEEAGYVERLRQGNKETSGKEKRGLGGELCGQMI